MKFEEPNKLQAFLDDLGVTPEHFAHYTGITLSTTMRSSESSVSQLGNSIIGIIHSVRPWFDSDFQSWAWYISEPIISLGNKTPAQIVKELGPAGVDAIRDYIASKNLGAFE